MFVLWAKLSYYSQEVDMRPLLSRFACFAFIAMCCWPVHAWAWTAVEPAPSDEQRLGAHTDEQG